MKDFGEKLNQLLSDKHITQGELCNKIGMSPQGLRKAIKKESLQISTVLAICKVLDVNAGYFIEIEVKPTGIFQKAIDKAYDELKEARMRIFRYEEKFGVLNFNWLRKCVNPFFCINYKGIY